MKIFADSVKQEQLLEKLAEGVRSSGGTIRSDTRVFCVNGQFSIEADSDYAGEEPLFYLPESVLIPTKGSEFFLEGDEIRIGTYNESLNELARLMLDTMLALYNETGKIAYCRSSMPWTAIPQDSRLFWKFLEARQIAVLARRTKPGIYKEEDQKLIEIFLQSRYLGYKGLDSEEKMQVIMPLVDFLNHHHRGSAFNVIKEGDGGVRVKSSHPIEGSNECYAMYGFYDAHDALINYGYVERHTPFMRSVSMRISLGRHGQINVNSIPGGKVTENIPDELKDISVFYPNVKVAGDRNQVVVVVDKLFIPSKKFPRSMKRILMSLIGMICPSENREVIKELAEQAEYQIVRNNLKYYQELNAIAEAADEVPNQIRNSVREVAKIQISIIRRYIDFTNLVL